MTDKTATGIHRVDHQIRRAEVRLSGRRMEVLRLDQKNLPASPGVSEGPTCDLITLAAVPALDTLTRFWTLPHSQKAQFRSILTHRLEADLPVPIDELTWSYRAAEGPSTDEGDLLLVQAVRTSRINRYLSELLSAGMEVHILTTEAEAIGALYRHVLRPRTEPGSEALILATAADWLVATFTGGLVRSLRRLRVTQAGTPNLLLEVRQSIEKELPPEQLRQVLWCAAEDVPVTPDQVRTMTGLPVVPVTLSDRLCHTSGTSLSESEIAVFGPAIGLALAGLLEKDKIIHLVTQEKEELSPRQQQIRRLLAHPRHWAAAALIGLVLAAAIHVGALRSENHKMQALLGAADNATAPMAALEPKMQALQRLAKYRVNALGVILDICRALPDTIVINSIQLSREQKLVLKGTSKDPKAVFALADTLRKSNRLAAINPERTEPGQGGGFTITAELLGVSKINSISERGGQWR